MTSTKFYMGIILVLLLTVGYVSSSIGYQHIGDGCILPMSTSACACAKSIGTDDKLATTRIDGKQWWPMFGKDHHHTNTAKPTALGINMPQLKWDNGWSMVTDTSWGTTIGNFTSNIIGAYEYDRNVEHVVYAIQAVVYIVDGGTGESLWELDADAIDGIPDDDIVTTTPSIADFNLNGTLDIVFGTFDGWLYVYEPTIYYDPAIGYYWDTNNTELDLCWVINLGGELDDSSAVLADITNDGHLDVILGAGNKIIALDVHNRNIIWDYEVVGNLISTPAIYEFSATERRVVVTATNLSYLCVYMIKPNGDLVWMDDTIQLSTGPAPEPPVAVLNLLPSPAIAELDDPTDGLEIVILSPIEAGDGRVYVYKGNGDRTQIFTASGQFEASPAVADINNDGNIDIVVSSWDTIIEYPTPNPVTYIYALHGKNGSLIWEEMRDTTFVNETGITLENSVATPAIADLNKDGVKDVIVAITPEVFALDGTDGDNLWQPYMLPNRIIWSSPALGDIDHDSFIDIAIAGATISQEVVDLVIPDPEEDITFSNDTLTEGVPVKISAIIHNKGNTDADEVVVNFYENNSFFAQVTIDVVPAGGTWEALVDWTPAAGGLRELKVELDPNNTISEVNENNNIAICYVKVNIPYPDFELRELKFYRADGVEVYVDDENGKHLIEGEPSTITAICYNKGDKDGTNVNLTFYVDGIMLGEPINIESFPRGQKRECSTTWVATIGYHDVNSWIDPNNNIREHNETNNWILVSQLYVKSRDPQGAPYIIEGKVYSPNGTSVIGATVTITNNETRESLTNFTDSSGYFKFDLNSFPSRYMEGDEILLYATDGINEYDNYANPIYAYSEDIGTYIDIQLKERPVYTFTVELDTQVKNIDPGSTAYYTMLVTNLGNRENAINFTVGLPLDTSTNTVATGWTARVLPSSIFLELNETVEVTLMVESSPDSPAYLEVRVDVTCSSFYDPGEVHHLFTITTINLKYQLALSTATISKQIDPRDTSLVVFEFKLTNLGNKRDKVTITHEGLEQKWSAEYPHTLTVEPSATVKFQFKITIDPDAGAGEYLVQVIASSEDGITTDKCTIFIEVIRPDLAITDADLQWEPAVPKVGQLITIYAKVSNIGKANATGVKVTIKVDLLELSVTPSTVDIAPHKSKDVRATWRPDSEGTYQIAVIIDKDNEIMEAIENNNEISKNISFYPDLVIDTKYIHLSNWHPQEQEKVTVTVELRNDGTADVIKSFKVIFYLGDPGDKHIIATIKITEVIEMDDYIEVTTEWTATHAGTYEIYVWADAENVIQELVEGNNVASVNITVRTRERADTYRDVGVSQELLAIGIIIIVAVIAVIVILYYPSKKKRRRGAAGVPRRKPKHKRVEEEKQILKEGAKKPKQAEPLEPVEVEPIIEEE